MCVLLSFAFGLRWVMIYRIGSAGHMKGGCHRRRMDEMGVGPWVCNVLYTVMSDDDDESWGSGAL